MKEYLFEDFHQWKVCVSAAFQHLFWGLGKLIQHTFFGIVSVFVYIGKQVEAFCKREITAAFIIAVIILTISIGWLATYLRATAELHTLEYQRDSISIRLDRMMQPYSNNEDSTTTILHVHDIQRTDGKVD